MNELDDLRAELQRLGRRPAPAPRPQFSEELLARLMAGETPTAALPAPTPLKAVGARRFAPARLAAVSSIAAALLLVVGLGVVATSRSDHNKPVTFTFSPGSASDPVPRLDGVRVDGHGSIVDDRGETLAGVNDGWATVLCEKAGTFKIADGRTYHCNEGDRMQVRVEGSRIVEIGGGPGPSEVAASPTSEGPAPTSSAPTTTTVPKVASSAPATVPTTSSVATTEPTSVTTATTPPAKVPPTAGPAATTAPAAKEFVLAFTAREGSGQVSFSWPVYSGDDFARYVMVRSVDSEVVTYPVAPPASIVWSSDSARTTGWIETDLPPGATLVRFRLFVIGTDGAVKASSGTVVVELAAKPASTGDGGTTTTTVAPTTTTSTTTPSTPPGPRGDAAQRAGLPSGALAAPTA